MKIFIIIIAIATLLAFTYYESQPIQVPQTQDIMGTLLQGENGQTTFHSGGAIVNLVSLINTTGPLNPGIEILGERNNAMKFANLAITALTVSDNFTENMWLQLFNSSTYKLENSAYGRNGSLAPFQFEAPIEKIVAGYTKGTVSITDQGSAGLNGSVTFHENYKEFYNISTLESNVVTVYPLNISTGLSSILLDLQSVSVGSFILIYFTPGYGPIPLMFGNSEYNVEGSVVMIQQFTNIVINLEALSAKLIFPASLVSSIETVPSNSVYDYFNSTVGNATFSSLSGQIHKVSGTVSVQSRFPIQISLSYVEGRNGPFIKYYIQTDFAQVFNKNYPVFTVPQYRLSNGLRVLIGLSAGAIVAAAVSFFRETLRSKSKTKKAP
ncbi:MAG: hypothetical protein QXU98_14210 [Candidatus Parvarchaeota archaeon]